jgi:hypothetical protein
MIFMGNRAEQLCKPYHPYTEYPCLPGIRCRINSGGQAGRLHKTFFAISALELRHAGAHGFRLRAMQNPR